MRRVLVLRRLSFLTQYWHWIFAWTEFGTWPKLKWQSLRWIRFRDMVKFTHSKQICSIIFIYINTCTCMIQQLYTLKFLEIYFHGCSIWLSKQTLCYTVVLVWLIGECKNPLEVQLYFQHVHYPQWISIYNLQTVYHNGMILLISSYFL